MYQLFLCPASTFDTSNSNCKVISSYCLCLLFPQVGLSCPGNPDHAICLECSLKCKQLGVLMQFSLADKAGYVETVQLLEETRCVSRLEKTIGR